MSDPSATRVSLFVTCLADLMRPSVAFASLELLEYAGCIVDVPEAQTCCGQPAYNTGDYEAGIPLAQRTIELFEHAEYVVAPSGSCAGMICHHYPKLLEGQWRERARDLASRTWELTSFLTEVVKIERLPPLRNKLPRITYHDSCAGLREMGVRQQPRQLLEHGRGVHIDELAQTEVCCGFGGTFCAKMPAISAKMADDKLAAASASGSGMLTGGDLGCLLHLAGRARRTGVDLEIRHVAEILAGDLDTPAIGEAE
ncbi:(Fe-S)-binding protein [Mangrovimicrobium sediminis]|uniref:(Fe-S)-binding protein n=1 Tax=Mangrovimicrobium sediminis TaxID=2562682 RepID=A0A4Z0M1N6_9GAMM|nr:(Fe-S)-binding protein [Haliea sp. SAOS-164]TGD73439.1 (Fe-S)-binding protein [Haliea sp. SAOS-164]